MLVDKTTKNNFAEFVHCVQTRISVPSEGKCFCFCTPARLRMGRGEGTSDFKWQGWSHGGKTQNTIKSLGLPTRPPKHPRTIIKLNNRFYEMDAMLFVKQLQNKFGCNLFAEPTWSGHNGTTILQLIKWPQKNNTCQIFLPPQKTWNPKFQTCQLKSGVPPWAGWCP